MKQERYRWVEGCGGERLISVDLPNALPNAIALVTTRGEDTGFWSIWSDVPVTGIGLSKTSDQASDAVAGKLAAALEIQRQLKARGIEVEIRQVSK